MFAHHFIRAILATAAITTASVADATSGDWISMVERLGLAVALVIFFVATGWQREKRMAARLDKLEAANNELERDKSRLAERMAMLTDQVTTALQRDSTLVAEALRSLNGRTCFAFRSREEFDSFREALAECRENKRLSSVEVTK